MDINNGFANKEWLGRIDGWRHELMNAWTEGLVVNERMDACMDEE